MAAPPVTQLAPYTDDAGNEVVYEGDAGAAKIRIRYRGRNNRLTVAASARIVALDVYFTGDNANVEIGPMTTPRGGLRLELRAGHDSQIRIGPNVGSSGTLFISAIEGTQVTVGADCMFAGGIELRTDDTHPIYSVPTGKRLNVSKSIQLGEHVWVAKHATVMGGVTIGDGSVVGMRSIVTSSIPNNCIAVGAPARIVRHDVAWERTETPYRPAAKHVAPAEKSEQYWNFTDVSLLPPAPSARDRAVQRLRAVYGRLPRSTRRRIRGLSAAARRRTGGGG